MALFLCLRANARILFSWKAVLPSKKDYFFSFVVLENSFIGYCISLIHSWRKKLSYRNITVSSARQKSVTQIIVYPAQTPSNLSGHWAAKVFYYRFIQGCSSQVKDLSRSIQCDINQKPKHDRTLNFLN